MGLILLEALLALVLLVGIVWWTMFSGRKRGERDDAPTELAETQVADTEIADTQIAENDTMSEPPGHDRRS